jgi:Holliday junction resolvase RusA-like endonuclease
MISIRVYGTPAPQGSKRVFPRKRDGIYTGQFAVVEQNKQPVRNWRDDVKAAALIYKPDGGPITGPVEVTVNFLLKRPKSHYGTGRNAAVLKPSAPAVPATSPDWDKLARSTMDALTSAGIWADDGQVWNAHVRKLYAPAGSQAGAVILIAPGEPPRAYLDQVRDLAGI